MFDFLKHLFGGGERGAADDRDALYVYVRCRSCGEVVRVRINPSNDLSPEYDESSERDTVSGYILSKEIVGRGTCFRRMHLEMTFDPARRERSREVQGGEFVTKEDYERYEAQRAAGSPGPKPGPEAGP